VALRQQDVLGLDVPVDDAVPVRVVEGVGDLARDPQRLVERELRLPAQRRKRRGATLATSSGFMSLSATGRACLRSCTRYTVAMPPRRSSRSKR
jgi:hypothetical protein